MVHGAGMHLLLSASHVSFSALHSAVPHPHGTFDNGTPVQISGRHWLALTAWLHRSPGWHTLSPQAHFALVADVLLLSEHAGVHITEFALHMSPSSMHVAPPHL